MALSADGFLSRWVLAPTHSKVMTCWTIGHQIIADSPSVCKQAHYPMLRVPLRARSALAFSSLLSTKMAEAVTYPCKTCGQYKTPSLATDAGVLRTVAGEQQVLLIERAHNPFKVLLAGGHSLLTRSLVG